MAGALSLRPTANVHANEFSVYFALLVIPQSDTLLCIRYKFSYETILSTMVTTFDKITILIGRIFNMLVALINLTFKNKRE
jgi:hypothetical protein